MSSRAASLAVVGSGPAAFYTVMRALKHIPDLRVAMFEKLAVPFGLTRFGVAPDHPEVKSCQERFEEVAAVPNFEFFGNCEVGKDVELPELVANFNAVLLAYGAQSESRLGIPGEQSLDGIISARHFVGWYNGEPQFQGLDMASRLKRAQTATVIGNGNVALDVARMLLRRPKDLAQTDITDEAVRQLQQSSVRHVEIVGRRGLLHSAFTNKELRELQEEPDTYMRPLHPASQIDYVASLPELSRQDKRKLKLLQDIKPDKTQHRTWQLAFLRAPMEFVGDNGRLQGIKWRLNKIDESGAVVPTDRTEFQATNLAFTSIGYKSLPLSGMSEVGIEFNYKHGTVPRQLGRVTRNVFASGWVGTGPVGVIAATMMDSFAVGEEIVKFLGAVDERRPGLDAIKFRDKPYVSWSDWLKVDREEQKRGKKEGKPREKFVSTESVLQFLDK